MSLNNPTLADLQNETLLLLAEATNSPVGQLLSGTGSSPVITTLNAITYYLNQGVDDLCRTAIAVPGTATGTAVVGQYSYSYSALPNTTDNGTLWYARAIQFNGVTLQWTSRPSIEVHYPNYQTDTGTPKYFYRNPTVGIGLYPAPAASGILTLSGFEISPQMSASGDALTSWIPIQQQKLPVWYAALMISLQNATDMSIHQRAQTWSEAYAEGKRELLMVGYMNDPTLVKAFGWTIPQPPVMPPPQQQ